MAFHPRRVQPGGSMRLARDFIYYLRRGYSIRNAWYLARVTL